MKKLASALTGGVAMAALGIAYAAAQDSVKIGYMATFSGPPGVLGEHNRDGFLLGIEHRAESWAISGKSRGRRSFKPDRQQIIDRYGRIGSISSSAYLSLMMAV